MKKTPDKRNIGFYVVIFAILIAVVYLLVAGDTSSVDVSYSEMRSLFENKQVSSFVLEDSTVKMKLNEEYKGAKEAKHKLYSLSIFYEDLGETIDKQYADGTLTEYNYKTGIQASWWVSIIPYLILMAGVLFLMYMMMGRSGGGAGGAVKFGKARTRVGIDE